jgi:hypothetical protein
MKERVKQKRPDKSPQRSNKRAGSVIHHTLPNGIKVILFDDYYQDIWLNGKNIQ